MAASGPPPGPRRDAPPPGRARHGRAAAPGERGPGEAPPDLAPKVIAWQRRHGRHDLPWQASRDPYRVWLSEVMLQQTQVATVLAYYPRFLQRFPDVRALAAAPLDEVLALWSGLGYYGRARNLHRCAQAVVRDHGGAFPGSAAALAALPGIGRSTAAAVAAFCFGERAAILDGNVKRVLARVLAFDADLAGAAAQRALWARAEALLPQHGVDAYTQGLMDLGATVCTASRPDCARCPLRGDCAAHALGRPDAYPVKTRRAARQARADVLLWLTQGDAVWLVQRPAQGIWAGLWSLPELGPAESAADLTAGWPGSGRWLEPVLHRLTHRDWTLQPLHWTLPPRLAAARRDGITASLARGAAAGPAPPGRWWPGEQALSLGLPAPVRRWLEQGPQR